MLLHLKRFTKLLGVGLNPRFESASPATTVFLSSNLMSLFLPLS